MSLLAIDIGEGACLKFQQKSMYNLSEYYVSLVSRYILLSCVAQFLYSNSPEKFSQILVLASRVWRGYGKYSYNVL